MPNTPDAAPVTAADVTAAVRQAVAVLREAPADADWSSKAGGLEWDCWETVEHLADDLFAYAAQLGPEQPPLDREVPFLWYRRRHGGPSNVTFADHEGGVAGLLQVLESCGALLTGMVATTPSTVRAHHGWGVSDPEGFAAMGIVETLVHTYDIAHGLGIGHLWDPPADLCARVLGRLFPDVVADAGTGDGDAGPWDVLLWATGRGTLPGRPRRTTWRWYGVPADER
ncbi:MULTISPECIES: hypothetical protein [unclassified Streptomyces]|uniref:hypothetical protein n=1 Tax=unclassified Streptomyces TaxID=2593676 RepID=UPI00136B89F4|nr:MULTISPECIES: hypothetical protein [unclassified Streptomyces]NDZ99436.1 hypothetical protein [Streptomyces sp. SID10116]MYY84968.1 hypothetical protein [Streptomyces sp. SID335]MYZ19671.1 hypothetical protein [Streptomyces sp. SID337]NDZ92112.1 hypothetical protein [Streptomyces sp. SID10115]NEB46767.1 hypothetical protein [Streptomyces sp. SID339]